MLSYFGKDGGDHCITIIGCVRLFDACDKAIQAVAKFWWFDNKAVLKVEAGGRRWKVEQSRMRGWRKSSGLTK